MEGRVGGREGGREGGKVGGREGGRIRTWRDGENRVILRAGTPFRQVGRPLHKNYTRLSETSVRQFHPWCSSRTPPAALATLCSRDLSISTRSISRDTRTRLLYDRLWHHSMTGCGTTPRPPPVSATTLHRTAGGIRSPTHRRFHAHPPPSHYPTHRAPRPGRRRESRRVLGV